MCLPVSLKVLIRRWTASRWGNTTMIRSQLWWHLRRNGKTQNISTPFCMITYVYPSIQLVLCWPMSPSKHIHVPDSPDSIQTLCALVLFVYFINEKTVIVDNCNENEWIMVTWHHPNPCALQWIIIADVSLAELVSQICFVTVSASCLVTMFIWDEPSMIATWTDATILVWLSSAWSCLIQVLKQYLSWCQCQSDTFCDALL